MAQKEAVKERAIIFESYLSHDEQGQLLVTTSSDIKHELKGSVDAMKNIIEEHGQLMESSIGLSIAMAVDTIKKRVGEAEDVLQQAAKVSSDEQKMNFDQLKEGQDSLERGQATLYETMNDRFDQLEKAIAENDEEAAKAKLWRYGQVCCHVKEEVENPSRANVVLCGAQHVHWFGWGRRWHGIRATGARCY